jgi:glycosyltransferase involved in cell wall biosynthesis
MVQSRFEDETLLVVAPKYSTFTKGQIDRLAERFDDVYVLVRYNRLTELADLVGSNRMKRHGPDVRIDDDSPANVTVIGTPLLYLPLDSWYRYLGIQHYHRVRRTIERHSIDFDLVHAHFTWPSGYVGARLKAEFDVPYVLTVHENEEWLTEELESGNRRVYRAWEDADAIIRVNEKDRARLRQFNDAVYHVPNGFEPARFPHVPTDEARETLGLSPDADVVFSLGDLVPRKQFDVLIDAVARLDDRSALTVAIGGLGEEQEALEAQIRDLGLEDTVRILGYVPEDELTYWMNACDIFTLASRSEGNPTVMFEALGCGRPYVGTDVGGVGEIIDSEEYGLVCEPGDVEALAEVLREGLATEWNNDVIREYAAQFTWESIAMQVLETFERSTRRVVHQ